MNAYSSIDRIMTEVKHLGTADWTVGQSIDYMLRHALSCLMVVDHHRRLIGLVTESSLLPAALDPMQRSESVSLFMQRKIVTIPESATWEEAVDVFLLHRVRQLPVLRNGVPVGMVSRRRLLEDLVHPQSGKQGAAVMPQSSVVDD